MRFPETLSLEPIYTCAEDVTSTIWCALPPDMALIVPLKPLFTGSLHLLLMIFGGA